MKHELSGRRVLAVVLLVAALCVGRVPSIGDKSIVRAALVSQAGGEWTVGLICMQPGQAADSADAEEQMSASWGSAEDLSSAFAQAEQSLGGKAVYKLCDIAAVSGEAPMQTLSELCRTIETSGCGRLAARVLYSKASAQALQAPELDASALYAALAAADEDAPRLYQAAGGSLLAPCVTLKEGTTLTKDGSACLTQSSARPLNETQTQAACLLQDGCRTFQLTEEGLSLTVQGVTGVQLGRRGATIVVRGVVRGLPAEQNARAALLKKAQASLQAQLREAQASLTQAGMDAAHTAAHEKQAYGAAQAVCPAVAWDVRLWAE